MIYIEKRPKDLVFLSSLNCFYTDILNRKFIVNRKKEIHFLKSLHEMKLLRKELDFSADVLRFAIHSFIAE